MSPLKENGDLSPPSHCLGDKKYRKKVRSLAVEIWCGGAKVSG